MKKKLFGVVSAGSVIALASLAAQIRQVPKLTVQEPGKTPERIILTWANDPAHTLAATWMTQKPTPKPQAQIARLTSEPIFEEDTTSVAGVASVVALENGKYGEHYSAEFRNLQPATKYCYRVGDGHTWSEWNLIRTADTRPEPFSFLYVGDAQNDMRSLWARTMRIAFATAPDMRFMIHAGDLVNEGFDDRFWKEWSDSLGFISAIVPSMPVPGNHEVHHAPGSADPGGPFATPPAWRQHFLLPMNGPEALRGQSYYLDYQGVRFILLDVNVFDHPAGPGTPQKKVQDEEVAWLEGVLHDNPNRWTIVSCHYPMYTVAKDRPPFTDMRQRLLPLYDKYGVDLVLQGHEHGYGRTFKMRGGKIVPDRERGTVYVVSVSGPDLNEVGPAEPRFFIKTIQNRQMFQIIGVNRERILYKAYTLDGAIADAFELKARNGAQQ